MVNVRRSLAASSVIAGLLLSACGSSPQTATTPAGRVLSLPGSKTGEVVLTRTGAERIGVRTAVVRAATTPGGSNAIIPYSALVYAPDGSTYAFMSRSALIFTEVAVDVDHIDGSDVYLLKGPKPGSRVVTVGAEELLGVQTGVLGQT